MAEREPHERPEEETMHGTVICAITDGAENDNAVAQAAAISERLGLRLVLAHVADGVAPITGAAGEVAGESIAMRGDRKAAEQRLDDLVRDHDLGASAERRIGVGDAAALLGQIASEEAADVIVVGSRKRGWTRRGFESRLAEDLESETPVPVLVAPPHPRRTIQRDATSGARRR
jgi:nucleotide-binding universal stress UspA family protein